MKDSSESFSFKFCREVILLVSIPTPVGICPTAKRLSDIVYGVEAKERKFGVNVCSMGKETIKSFNKGIEAILLRISLFFSVRSFTFYTKRKNNKIQFMSIHLLYKLFISPKNQDRCIFTISRTYRNYFKSNKK